MSSSLDAESETRVALPAEGLRVLAFTDYLFEGSCGGAERVAREVYKRLIRWGAEVMVLTASPKDDPGMGEVDGIPVTRVRSIDLSRILGAQVSIAPGLIKQALRLVDEFRPDVLHANSIHFQTTVAAAVCRQRRNVPLVTTGHIGGSDKLGLALRAQTRVYERTVSSYILRRSDRVIAVAPSVAEHLQTLRVSPGDIEVILNGVDHEHFSSDVALGWFEEPPVIVFVGRMIQNKGPQVFLDAISRLNCQGEKVRAVFVGDGPMRPQLQTRVVEEHLSGVVEFAGPVTDVAPWLSRASILVRPSFTEGLPLTVLEAMASEVLVVASDIPGNNDLIQDGQNGLLFAAGSAQGLADKISGALADRDGSAAMAAAGNLSSLTYSWDACATATLKVLVGRLSLANR